MADYRRPETCLPESNSRVTLGIVPLTSDHRAATTWSQQLTHWPFSAYGLVDICSNGHVHDTHQDAGLVSNPKDGHVMVPKKGSRGKAADGLF